MKDKHKRRGKDKLDVCQSKQGNAVSTFHNAKSNGFRFLGSTATRDPGRLSSNFLPDRLRYSGKLSIEKYTPSPSIV
jgi:hypothetical protein